MANYIYYHCWCCQLDNNFIYINSGSTGRAANSLQTMCLLIFAFMLICLHIYIYIQTLVQSIWRTLPFVIWLLAATGAAHLLARLLPVAIISYYLCNMRFLFMTNSQIRPRSKNQTKLYVQVLLEWPPSGAGRERGRGSVTLSMSWV